MRSCTQPTRWLVPKREWAGLTRRAVGLALLTLACLQPSTHAAGEASSACQAVTPPDAPYGCLEIFPLGASANVTFDGVSLGLSP